MSTTMPESALADLQIDESQSIPLHQQILDRIKQAISTGSLPPGARLPSSRSLASQLSISRATVELAYNTLAGEGYVNRQNAAGTRVHRRPGEHSPRQAAPSLPLPRPPQPLMPGLASEAAQAPRLFQMGIGTPTGTTSPSRSGFCGPFVYASNQSLAR